MAGKGAPRTGGRGKGTSNKTTAEVKQIVLTALHDVRVGGVEFFIQLAQDDPRSFASIVAKLIPRDIVAEVKGDGLVEAIYDAREREQRTRGG